MPLFRARYEEKDQVNKACRVERVREGQRHLLTGLQLRVQESACLLLPVKIMEVVEDKEFQVLYPPVGISAVASRVIRLFKFTQQTFTWC